MSETVERDPCVDAIPGDAFGKKGSRRIKTTYFVRSFARSKTGSIMGVIMDDSLGNVNLYKSWKVFRQWAATAEVISRGEK